MRYKSLFTILAVLFLSSSIWSTSGSCDAPPDHARTASEFVTMLAHKDTTAALKILSPKMKAAITPEQLASLFGSIESQFGQFKGQTGTRREKQGAYDIFYVTCAFERNNLDAKIVIDSAQQVAGLFFMPTPIISDSLPPYVNKSAFTEDTITVNPGPWGLPGALTIPTGEGPFPAVVLVHGSGPNDKDESVGACRPFRDLAMGLSTKGIAVLRYDKRTRAHSMEIAQSDAKLTAKEEVIDDVSAAVDQLTHKLKIDSKRIFVLGHSFGGMLVPRIAQVTPAAKGYIVIAGATRHMEDMMLEQVLYIVNADGQVTPEESTQVASTQGMVAAIKKLATDSTASTDPSTSSQAAYWRDLSIYEPAVSARVITKPILFLQGERDYQVTMVDFQRWRTELKGDSLAVFKSYPKLNHLFVSGENPSMPQEYNQPGFVDKQVIDDIAAWISGLK